MERLFSAPAVVVIWGALNALMVGLLIGFVASGFGGGMVLAEIYGSSVGLVFLVALLTWVARRRRPQALAHGLRVPARPASAFMLALAFTLLWLGLPFGMWVSILAVGPSVAGVLMEFSARRSARKLRAAAVLTARPSPASGRPARCCAVPGRPPAGHRGSRARPGFPGDRARRGD
jgi:uncharacterized membrane protein YuzA (DUF378 family)